MESTSSVAGSHGTGRSTLAGSLLLALDHLRSSGAAVMIPDNRDDSIAHSGKSVVPLDLAGRRIEAIQLATGPGEEFSIVGLHVDKLAAGQVSLPDGLTGVAIDAKNPPLDSDVECFHDAY